MSVFILHCYECVLYMQLWTLLHPYDLDLIKIKASKQQKDGLGCKLRSYIVQDFGYLKNSVAIDCMFKNVLEKFKTLLGKVGKAVTIFIFK